MYYVFFFFPTLSFFNLFTSFSSSLSLFFFLSSFPYPPLFVLPLWRILRFHLEGLRFVGCSTGIGLFCNTPSPRKGPRFAREAHAPASCQPQSPLRLTIRASMFVCISVLYICMSIHAPCHAPVSTYASLRAVSHLWASFLVESGLSSFTNPPALEPVRPKSLVLFFPLFFSPRF